MNSSPSLKRLRPTSQSSSSDPTDLLNGLSTSSAGESSSPKRAMSEDNMEDRRVGSGSSQPEGVESEEQHEVEMTDAEEVENGVKGMEVDMDDLPTMPPVRRGEEVPGLKEQLEVIEAGITKPMMPDQHWYILPTSWLRILRSLATNDSKSTPASLSDLSHPDLEPLINSSLYDAAPSIGPNGEGLFFGSESARGDIHEGGWRVKDTLVQGEDEDGDMVFVPSETWEKIVRWYGESNPPSGLIRCTQSNNQGEVVIEVNPPTLLLYRAVGENETLSPSPPLRITTSKFAQLSELHSVAKEALGVDMEEKSRLWKLEMPPAVLTETPSTANGSGMEVEPPTYGDSTTTPTVGVPARRFSSLSAKLLTSQPRDGEGRRGGLDDDPLVEDALLENGDCLAIEVPKLGVWSVEVGEEGQAQEKVQPKPPLFSQPFTYAGNGVASSSKLAPGGIITRSQAAAAGPSKGKTRGLKGLQNLGNTCFMNSALQCLSNTKELSEYFQSDEYLTEVNKTNPLGMHGRVALAFGNLIKELWDPSSGSSSNSYYSGNSVTPREFKLTIGKFAPSFAGYGQQDTQELLAFLLDGLHEDLNRIYKKPYIEKPDWKDGGTDEDLARMGKECWDGYRKRNDSIIVDLFQGQLKSTLICPDCKKKSITLDPFMYLTVPIPVTQSFQREVYFVPADPKKRKMRMRLLLKMDATFSAAKQKISQLVGVPANRLIAIDEFNGRIYAYWPDDKQVQDARREDVIVFHESPVPVTQADAGTRSLDSEVIVVPVYTATTSTAAHRRSIGHPMFVALDRKQRGEVMSIMRVIANANAALVVEDKAQELWMSRNEDSTTTEITVQDGLATARNLPTTPSKPRNDLYELFFTSREGRSMFNKPTGMFYNDPPNQPDSLKDRLHSAKPLSSRIANGISGMMGSNPPSDDEDHGHSTQQRKAHSLVKANDGIIVTWNDDAALEFLGAQYQGRYAQVEDFEYVEDPDIAGERKRASQKKSIDLDDCLNEFSKPEVLGEHDLWYCSNCKDHKAATKRMEIYQVPDILVICIKRFSGTGYRSLKMSDDISFPTNGLELNERCDEKRVAQALQAEGKNLADFGLERALEPLVYDLYAVDNHYGGLGGGHYTANCKNFEDGKWYNYDDSRVSPAGESELSGSSAYLLFYRKRTARSIGGRFREKVERALSSRGVSPAGSLPRTPFPETESSTNTSTPLIDTAPPSPPASEDQDHDMDGDSPMFKNVTILTARRRDSGHSSQTEATAPRDVDELVSDPDV